MKQKYISKSFAIIISILLISIFSGCFENENIATDTLYKKTTIIGDVIYEKSREFQTSINETEYINETFTVSKEYNSFGIRLYIKTIFESELEIKIKNPNNEVVYHKTKTQDDTKIDEKQKIDAVKGDWKVEYKYKGRIKELKIKIIGLESNTIRISDSFIEDRKHDWIEISMSADGWGENVKITILNPKDIVVYNSEFGNGSDVRTLNSSVGNWSIRYESTNWSGLISLKLKGVMQGRDESQTNDDDWWGDSNKDENSQEKTDNKNDDKDEICILSTIFNISFYILIIIIIILVLIIGIFIGKGIGRKKEQP